MKKNALSYIILLLAGFALLYVRFGDVIDNPNTYQFGYGVDADKSYFNFAYILKHGHEGVKHQGINYPYGEHLHMCNSHPAYVYVLDMLKGVIPFETSGPGIMNLGMLISMLIALPFFFLLLRHYGLPRWYAVIMALALQFLYPQFGRLAGHFEMVIAYIFPAAWYFLIRFEEGKKYKWLWYAAAFLTMWSAGMQAAYLIAYCSVFILAYVLVIAYEHRKNFKAALPKILALTVLAMAPLMMIKTYVDVTDFVDDRPTNPWGFFIFNSNPFAVLLPPNASLLEIVPFSKVSYNPEGRDYIGFMGVLFVLSLIVYLVLRLAKQVKLSWSAFFPDRQINRYLAAAFIVLLYSFCVPFKWYPFTELVEALPILKQFRCLGRFSWVFYYVFVIFISQYAFILYRYLRSKNYRYQAYLLLFFFMASYSMDALMNMSFLQTGLVHESRRFGRPNYDFPKAIGMTKEAMVQRFQGIMTVPLKQTHGDKMLFEKGSGVFGKALDMSYQTGIPLVQSFAPRISFSQSESTIQLLADPCIRKTRLDDMNDKELLVFFIDHRLKEKDRNFIKRCELIADMKDYKVYSLDPQKLKDAYTQCAEAAFNELDSSQQQYHNPELDAKIAAIYNREGAGFMPGSPALVKKKANFNVFEAWPLHTLVGASPVEISAWMKQDYTHWGEPDVFVDKIDSDGNLVKSTYLYQREEQNVMQHWIRLATAITPEAGFTYSLRMQGKYFHNVVSDLRIRPVLEVQADLLPGESQAITNNFLISK